MNENICEQCGQRNEPGVQFCVNCQAFLPWYDQEDEGSATPSAGTVGADPAPVTAPTTPATSATSATSAGDGPASSAVPAVPAPVTSDPGADTSEARSSLQITVEPTAVTVTPGGDPESVEVRVHNLSPIVDAYVVEIVEPPGWLTASTAEVRLLPTTNDLARVTLSIAGGALVPAGAVDLVLRVRSQAHPEIWVSEPLQVTVPAIEAPIGLRLDPSMVRAKDSEPGRLQATVDNKGSNKSRRVTLSGRDPEGVVRFTFSPSVLDLEPGQSANAQVQVQAPKPEAGQQATRQLTIVASDGSSEVEATATFVQVAAADTPLALRLEPSLLRVRDSDRGTLEAVLDNRRGTRTRRVFLSGRDPEGVVTFTVSPPSVDVFAGEAVTARVRLAAAPPEAGKEVTRTVTVVATSDGSADIEATATFVQATSAVAPLMVQLDPIVVRVRDSVSGTFDLIIDNRGGRRVRRVALAGRDPERLVRFTFTPPSLDVLPDTIGRARVVVQAPPPDAGQESTRQLTISATDGGVPVELTGTFVQTTSVSAPVVVKLEPSLVRVRDSPVGQFQVIADNRQGIRGRRVTLAGSDPERAVGFSFWPPVLEIGPGEIGRATARIEAHPPEPGAESTRQFVVTASDGERDIDTSGTFVQTTTPPPPDQPLVLRLDPSLVRVRNRGTGALTAVADNRGGGRPRRVYFAGHDPERVIRFGFSPEFLDLAPGQVGSVQARISAPRPDGGAESTRPFTVVASDGERDTEASGSFVQEQSDRRPLWRILLTLLGGLMMIGGVFTAWNVGANIQIGEFGAPLGDEISGLEWNLPAIDVASDTFIDRQLFLNVPDSLDPLLSAGSLIILLAVIAMLGLTGPKGRLTRLAALVAAVFMAAFLIGVSLAPNTGHIGPGVILVFAGCAVAFVGGLLAKPRGS